LQRFRISSLSDPPALLCTSGVFRFFSTLFMQFLGQRAEKDQQNEARWGQSNLPTWQQGGKDIESNRKAKLEYFCLYFLQEEHSLDEKASNLPTLGGLELSS